MSIIIPANSAVAGGYDVPNGVRFNTQSSTEYMQRNMSSTGNLQAWTVSVWVKRAVIADGQHMLFASYNDSNNSTECFFEGNDTLNFRDNESGSFVFQKKTTMKFQDPSAWYHLVMSSSAGAQKIYVNGVEVTAFDTNTNGSGTSTWNGPYSHSIGANVNGGADKAGLYMAEFTSIDGQTLTPTSFGEFNEDSGVWQPIDVTGLTFGTNGFYLPFSNSSALGEDFSGNNLDFAVNNMDATNQTTDTCTNNFAVLNRIDKGYGTVTYVEGNLKATSSSGWNPSRGTISVTAGKWYWETMSGNSFQIGVCNDTIDFSNNDNAQDLTGTTVYYNAGGGYIRTNGSQVGSTSGTFSASDVAGFALDMDNKKLSVYKNGSIIVTNTSLSTSITNVAMIFGTTNGGGNFRINFGSPFEAISSGNSDGNGYGNFEYSVPSGYLALCTKNLSEVNS